jgi:uncharacterized protein GlcG (DUF336 family)/NAD-dependent dihydropyrimidine dehydrogenase PreA subunit
MPYVIAEPCIGEKNGACVDVCPAACIHTTPTAPQNYIDPDVCIECEQCVLVCPVNAVFLDNELPDEWQRFIDINASFVRRNKASQQLEAERAAQMAELVRAYAVRSGLLAVAAVVLDGEAHSLASIGLPGADQAVLDQAANKAYTALSYGVATHELRADSKPLWLTRAEIDPQRVLMTGGGFPVVQSGATIGAIGVAGSPAPAQDILCCQAALIRNA